MRPEASGRASLLRRRAGGVVLARVSVGAAADEAAT